MDGGRKVMRTGQELIQAVEQLKNGEEAGFNQIYSSTYPYVYARARQLLKDGDEAFDLTQEVYVAAYRGIKSLKAPDTLFAWLGSITMRQGMKMLKKKNRNILLSEESQGMFEELPEGAPGPEESVMDQAKAEIMKEIVEELPSLQRSAVIAYYYDGMKVEQVAEAAEASIGTIKTRLHLARKYMKAAIQEKEKKEGYALHGFSAPLLVYALRLLLEETTLPQASAQAAYNNICQMLGIGAGKITAATSAGNIASMAEAAKTGETGIKLIGQKGIRDMRNEMLQKVLGLGRAKLAAIAVGTVAIIGAGTGTGLYLHHQNQVQETQIQAQEKEKAEKEAGDQKKEEQAKAQEQKNLENLSMRTQALREKLQEVIVTEEEYKAADGELKKLEDAVKEKKAGQELLALAGSLEKTMETYIQKSAQYLLEKEMPVVVADLSAWEEGRLNTFQGVRTEYDGLKGTSKYKSADGKLELLLAEIAKGVGTQVAENTDGSGASQGTGTSGTPGKNNGSQSQAGSGNGTGGGSQGAGGSSAGSTGGSGSGGGSNPDSSVGGGSQAPAPEEQPVQQEQVKEPERKQLWQTWTEEQVNAVDWACMDYDCGMSEEEIRAKYAEILAGKTLYFKKYPAGANIGEAEWRNMDAYKYVVSNMLGNDEQGCTFVYAK